MARKRGKRLGPLPGLAQRDHAAADDRESGHSRSTNGSCERWPTVEALAAADPEDASRRLGGARLLLAGAQPAQVRAGRRLPSTAGSFRRHETRLGRLPGIGPYTAAAIAAIAFGEPATPVDGNIERVVSRLFAVRHPLPAAKREIKRLAASLTPQRRAGDFAQAMMDLGATVCTPKRPSCLMCPLQQDCHAHALGIEAQLPGQACQRSDRPVRYGIGVSRAARGRTCAAAQTAGSGLARRHARVPSSEWGDDWLPLDQALSAQPVKTEWWSVPGVVSHTFTHFRLELMVLRAIVPVNASLTFWADARSVPVGCAPRSRQRGAAVRHAQGDRARAEGALRKAADRLLSIRAAFCRLTDDSKLSRGQWAMGIFSLTSRFLGGEKATSQECRRIMKRQPQRMKYGYLWCDSLITPRPCMIKDLERQRRESSKHRRRHQAAPTRKRLPPAISQTRSAKCCAASRG